MIDTDKYEAWTVSLTDDNGIELSQIEYECENQALVAYHEMTQSLPPYHGVVLTHHTDWEMTDNGEFLPKSWTTIVPCMHIDTANTLDGEVCLDCGAETGGEEE